MDAWAQVLGTMAIHFTVPGLSRGSHGDSACEVDITAEGSFEALTHFGECRAYEVDITVDTAAEVAFFAFVDPDGDASTPDYSVASDANPVSVEAGGVYTGIDFVIASD